MGFRCSIYFFEKKVGKKASPRFFEKKLGKKLPTNKD